MFPIWYGFMWLIERVLYGPPGGSLVSMFLANWLTTSIPLVGGGILHELLLWSIPRKVGMVFTRLVAVICTLLIPVILVLVDSYPNRYSHVSNWGPLLLGLIVYGLVVELPQRGYNGLEALRGSSVKP